MKRITVLFILTLIATTGLAKADFTIGSAFGTLTTARTVGQGKGNFLIGAGIADATSFFGQFTFGMSTYTDGRLKLAIYDADTDDLAVSFGADFKWQFWNVKEGRRAPFDMATGALFEFVDVNGFSAVQFGGHLIGSYPFAMRNGSTLSPYARINIRLESKSFDTGPGFSGDNSNSDLEFGFNGGLKYDFSPTVAGFFEFQLDGNDGIFFGIDFNIM
ncbi:MAG: hypothetical protein SGI97_08855 [candidate division Zixibacteria bacterium]|nr:hypothetical protein [candidate division Zixibacteria bacterium]